MNDFTGSQGMAATEARTIAPAPAAPHAAATSPPPGTAAASTGLTSTAPPGTAAARHGPE